METRVFARPVRQPRSPHGAANGYSTESRSLAETGETRSSALASHYAPSGAGQDLAPPAANGETRGRGATSKHTAVPGAPGTAAARRVRRPKRSPTPLVFITLVGLALHWGWQNRGEQYLTAESGPGYTLGIAGATFMLLLLLYPLRKKASFMRRLGATKYWFRAHMVFGVLGPVMILFHANFSLGSTNSNVALIAMTLVVASGFVGRYIYSKIHHGLYGRRASLSELRCLVEGDKDDLNNVLAFAPLLQQRLNRIEATASEASGSLMRGLAGFGVLSVTTRWMRFRLLRELKRALNAEASRCRWSAAERRKRRRQARRHVSVYLATVRKVAGFGFFERLFSLWHTLHLPLFVILLIASVVHVFAVHMY